MSLLEQCGVQDVAARPEPTGAPAEPVRHIVLENICFAYDDGEDLYTGVNMELRAGDWVLLKGRSGIGKSTLALLACGMLQPSRGRVLINGEELTDQRFRELRSQVCYISPDLHVLNLPIRDNVFLAGRPDERLFREVVARTRMEAVVERLEGDRFGTVGADAEHLSLGERQRLLLMQAFVKRPSLVILDEATSNVDLELEDAVLASLLEVLSPDAITLQPLHHRLHPG